MMSIPHWRNLRRVAYWFSGAQIEELKSLVESMDDAAEAEDFGRYYALHLSFH
jgi:DNA-binding GntR family transcriptional regulator